MLIRARIIYYVCLLVIGLFIGCSKSAKFTMGGIINGEPVEPEVRIITPNSDIAVQSEKKFHCEVRLHLPPKGTLPVAVHVDMLSEGKSFLKGELKADLLTKEGYSFAANIRVPSQVGEYSIVIETIYYSHPHNHTITNEQVSSPEVTKTVFRSYGSRLRVIKQ